MTAIDPTPTVPRLPPPPLRPDLPLYDYELAPPPPPPWLPALVTVIALLLGILGTAFVRYAMHGNLP